jgi:glyoxylase-like metal-dependent hydrolase (beta-lactamase superfamily II)
MQIAPLPTFIEVHPRLYGVACPFGADGVVYVYILKTDPPVLIDTGVTDSPRHEITPALERVGVRWSDLGYIINTHGHLDHMGGNETALRLAPQAKVLIHEADLPFMQSVDAHISFLPDPTLDVAKQAKLREVRRHELKDLGLPTRVDQLIHDGDVLEIGDVQIRVMHVPGHSAGSCALFIENDGVLIAADAAQARGSRPRRFPFVFDDPSDYLRSQRQLAQWKLQTLCLGHAYLWQGVRAPVHHGAQAQAFLTESCNIAERLLSVAQTEKEKLSQTSRPGDWAAFQLFAAHMLTEARELIDSDYSSGATIPEWAVATLWQYWSLM